jgi:hypothetical protein
MPKEEPTLGHASGASYYRTGWKEDMPESNQAAHRIRLRGPWLLQPTAVPSTPPRRIQLPAPWAELFEADVRGVQLSRRFNRPTNLGPTDRISLVVNDLPPGARVSLNGITFTPQPQDAAQPAVFQTPHLELHNLLTIEFDVAAATAADDQIWGEVALVISNT